MKNNSSWQLSEEEAKKSLEYYAKNYKIFIDTCSLMNINIFKFYEHICPYLKENSNKIIVPNSVIQELNKHLLSLDEERCKKAANALRVIKNLRINNLLDIRGESSDNFADNVFLVVFTKFRMNFNLLLITQDIDLSKEILNLNNSKAVKGKQVLAKRINKYGYLSNVENFPMYGPPPKTSRSYIKNNTRHYIKIIPPIDKFALGTKVTKYKDNKVTISKVPKENDMVTSQSGGKILLKKRLASGGEGSVYSTNSPYVAKIYKKEKLNKEKLEKIKLMASKKIDFEGICWPVEILYNSNKEFVGYLMPYAKGKEMQRLFLAKPVLLKNMPTWKKRDTVELCITILKKIKYLHDRNIILGDINPLNILIVSSTEVYFVDTDSYQIEGFPCPVGTIPFTAQEILREDISYKNKYKKDRKYSEYLRTFENEYFSVAVLLFMIMLPGKNPYSLQGGESIKENMLNMDFAYPLGVQSNRRTPDGPWKFIWSHMCYSIKEDFYETFSKGGKYSTPQTRMNVKDWIKDMKHYLELLDSGKLGKQDKMSEEIFPTRRKKVMDLEYGLCRICNTEVPEDTMKHGICKSCLRKEEFYNCSKCGKKMVLSNYDKYIKHFRKKHLCRECSEYENNVHSRIICVDCHNVFELTNREYDYFTSKGLSLPKRCKTCREKKKNTSYSKPHTYTHHDNNKSGCFITTAVCEYYHKEDDCYELTTLRRFRDRWLLYEKEGMSLINEYYTIAPKIVKSLENNPLKHKIYKKLYYDYISVCVKLIENKKYEECKMKYIEMVNYLKKICLMEGGDCFGRK